MPTWRQPVSLKAALICRVCWLGAAGKMVNWLWLRLWGGKPAWLRGAPLQRACNGQPGLNPTRPSLSAEDIGTYCSIESEGKCVWWAVVSGAQCCCSCTS